jgi:glycosyltransferase involved in cell wall biosynthesis
MDVIAGGLKGALLGAYDRLLAPAILHGARAVAVSSLDYAAHSSLRRRRLRTLVEVPFGVDPGHYSPGPIDTARLAGLGLDPARPILLFVGGMDVPHAFKGIPVLLNAFSSAELGQRAQLVLVGDGDLRPSFEQLTRDLGIGRHTHFLGRTHEADLISLYRAASATVLPSTTGEEAFGLVLIEAMGCGSPVVASSLPGVRTVVGSGEEARGLLVPPGNSAALGDALARLLDDAGLRRAFRTQALEAVATKFSRAGEAAGLERIVTLLRS